VGRDAVLKNVFMKLGTEAALVQEALR